jgi:hypothetical protein
MPQMNETPAGSLAGVSCNQLRGCLHEQHTPLAHLAQHFNAEYSVHPGLAANLAILALRGNRHGLLLS